jgi:peptidoglycan hydrolase CwlO-like protein
MLDEIIIRLFGPTMDKLTKRVNRLEREQKRMWGLMASFAEELDGLSNEMASRLDEYERVNAELRAAVANNDTSAAAALAAQSEAHAAAVAEVRNRLRDLGTDPQNPVPDTSPLPEPPPAEETPAQ